MKDEIIKSLQPMFDRARKEHLWFHCSYDDIWLTPDELAGLHKEGRLIWGPDNWELRDPQELIDQKERLIKTTQESIRDIQRRAYGDEWVICERCRGEGWLHPIDPFVCAENDSEKIQLCTVCNGTGRLVARR